MDRGENCLSFDRFLISELKLCHVPHPKKRPGQQYFLKKNCQEMCSPTVQQRLIVHTCTQYTCVCTACLYYRHTCLNSQDLPRVLAFIPRITKTPLKKWNLHEPTSQRWTTAISNLEIQKIQVVPGFFPARPQDQTESCQRWAKSLIHRLGVRIGESVPSCHK